MQELLSINPLYASNQTKLKLKSNVSKKIKLVSTYDFGPAM